MHPLRVLSLIGLSLSHVAGFEPHQAPLVNTKPHTGQESTIINFDELPTDYLTGLGAANSFTHRNLTFKSFQVADVPTTIFRPDDPWDTHEIFCMGSAPNVIVGSRANASNLWPTISACSLDDDPGASQCNGTFNVVAFNLRPMGIMPGPDEGVGYVVVNVDFLRLGQFKDVAAADAASDDPDILPPLKPGFPPRDPTKTTFGLFTAWFRPGPAPSGRVNMRRLRAGFAAGVDTMQMYGHTYPLPGSGAEPVDWPFCIDDLEIEFNPEGEESMFPEGIERKGGVWREEMYF